jgi:hypothetical protein
MRSPTLWKPWGVLDSKAYTTPVAVIASAAKIVATNIFFLIFLQPVCRQILFYDIPPTVGGSGLIRVLFCVIANSSG